MSLWWDSIRTYYPVGFLKERVQLVSGLDTFLNWEGGMGRDEERRYDRSDVGHGNDV
jgi:hypothetical protein